MSQAIVDPAELRRFAQGLRRFNGDLARQMTALQSQLTALATTWRDQEHKKFAEEFQQQLTGIAAYIEMTDEYVRFLMRKADRAEEYLQQR
jgi:uncharacterized protein YukE